MYPNQIPNYTITPHSAQSSIALPIIYFNPIYPHPPYTTSPTHLYTPSFNFCNLQITPTLNLQNTSSTPNTFSLTTYHPNLNIISTTHISLNYNQHNPSIPHTNSNCPLHSNPLHPTHPFNFSIAHNFSHNNLNTTFYISHTYVHNTSSPYFGPNP